MGFVTTLKQRFVSVEGDELLTNVNFKRNCHFCTSFHSLKINGCYGKQSYFLSSISPFFMGFIFSLKKRDDMNSHTLSIEVCSFLQQAIQSSNSRIDFLGENKWYMKKHARNVFIVNNNSSFLFSERFVTILSNIINYHFEKSYYYIHYM